MNLSTQPMRMDEYKSLLTLERWFRICYGIHISIRVEDIDSYRGVTSVMYSVEVGHAYYCLWGTQENYEIQLERLEQIQPTPMDPPEETVFPLGRFHLYAHAAKRIVDDYHDEHWANFVDIVNEQEAYRYGD